jgi:hypothetical protein
MERLSRPETPFIDRSNPPLVEGGSRSRPLFKEVLGPRNANLFLRRCAGVEMGPGDLFSEISVESHHRKPITLLG